MGNTPNFGFPYPDGTEYIDASAFSSLATAIDTEMKDIEGTHNPTRISIDLVNGWSQVGERLGRAVRAYRMGRLVQVEGEVIYNPDGSVVGQPVPQNRWRVFTLPVGWRPGQRFRVVAPRSSGHSGELHVGNDGIVEMRDALVRHITPGYSIKFTLITDDD